ncbi:MAG: hypothetical protein CMB80_33725 [Flammeovirgaceae bacterium]|nr:hypothetical protein [Flammeovirgaceae bacterium]MBE61328.1 hypothetical protein [Flammeovirgaceae bacterium]|tara:strand:- start:167 stop:1810 length:1644 start_codon:yes stop_codon:yes gene_type:complete
MLLLIILLNLQASHEELISNLNSAKKMEESSSYDEAFKLYNESLIISQELDDDSLETEILIRLGTILGKSGNLKSSELKFRKANKIARHIGLDNTIGKSLLGIGNVKYFLLEFDSAMKYYASSIPYLYASGDSSDARGAINNIAVIFNEYQNYDQSIDLLNGILLSSELSKDTVTITTFSRNFGLALLSLNRTSDAEEAFQMSLAYATASNAVKDQIYALSGLIKVAQQNKELENSTEYFQLIDSLINEYFHHDQTDKILELETKFRTAEIERDNAIKQAKIEVQDQRMIYLYAIAAFLILGIVGLYLYNEQRKKVIRAIAAQKNQENEQRINDLLSDQELKSAYAMLAGQEKAHKRIAQELHDNLGSILVTLNMFADSLQNKKDPEALKQLASRISVVAQQANETTRQISHSLDSGVLKHFGLEIAVKELMNALGDSGSIKVENHVQITSQLDSELSMNIYRIIQELVNNTLKHSKASKITLELNQIKDHLSLIYYDNGIGFIKEEIEPGMGLKNLESRVDNLDGTITIDSQPNKGTTTIIDVPVA